jgi:hypothetical protein
MVSQEIFLLRKKYLLSQEFTLRRDSFSFFLNINILFLLVRGSLTYYAVYAQMFLMKMCTYETFFELTVELGQSSSPLSTLLHKKRHGLKRIAWVQFILF